MSTPKRYGRSRTRREDERFDTRNVYSAGDILQQRVVSARQNIAFDEHVVRARTKSPPKRVQHGLDLQGVVDGKENVKRHPKKTVPLSVLRVRYNSMTPATRQYMYNCLEKVDRILILLHTKQVSKSFMLWRCLTILNPLSTDELAKRRFMRKLDSVDTNLSPLLDEERLAKSPQEMVLSKLHNGDILKGFNKWKEVGLGSHKQRVMRRVVYRIQNCLCDQGFQALKDNAGLGKPLSSKDVVRKMRRGICRRVLIRLRNGKVGSAFNIWRDMTQPAKRGKMLIKYLRRMINRKLHMGFTKWRLNAVKYTHEQRVLVTCKRVFLRLMNRQLSLGFSKWVSVARSNRDKLSGLNRTKQIMLKFLAWNQYRAFSTWRSAVMRMDKAELKMRGIVRILTKSSHRQLYGKFHLWKSHTLYWKIATGKMQHLRRFIGKLLNQKVSRAFRRWKYVNGQLSRLQPIMYRLVRFKVHSAFKIWVSYVHLRNRNTERAVFLFEVFLSSRKKRLMFKGWTKWKHVHDTVHRNDVKRQTFLRNALKRLGHRSVLGCFERWKLFLYETQKADIMAQVRLLCTSFFKWRLNVTEIQRDRMMASKHEKDIQAARRRVLGVWRRKRLRNALAQLKRVDRSKLAAKRVLSRLLSRKLNAAFQTWRLRYLQWTGAWRIWSQVLNVAINKLLRPSFTIWKNHTQYVITRNHKERLLVNSLLRMNRSVVERCFFGWKTFTKETVQTRKSELDMAARENSIIARFRERSTRGLLRKYFQLWFENMDVSMQRKGIISKWIRNTVNRSLGWAMNRWREFANISFYLQKQALAHHTMLQARLSEIADLERQNERSQTRILDQIVNRMRNQTLNKAFRTWEGHVRIRHLLRTSAARIQGNQLQLIMQGWHRYAKTSVRRRLQLIMQRWSKFARGRTAVRAFCLKNRSFRIKNTAFQAWKGGLRRERAILKRFCSLIVSFNLRRGFRQLHQVMLNTRITKLEGKLKSLSLYQHLSKAKDWKRRMFARWNLFTEKSRKQRQLRSRIALKRLKKHAQLGQSVKKLCRKAYLRSCSCVFRAWRVYHRNVKIQRQAILSRMMKRRSRCFYAWLSTARKNKQDRKCVDGAIRLLARNTDTWRLRALRKAFNTIQRSQIIEKAISCFRKQQTKVFYHFIRRGFNQWVRVYYVSTIQQLKRRIRVLSKTATRSNRSMRHHNQELERYQDLVKHLQEKVDRLQCRNHPKTYREQIAEDRFYERRRLVAGEPLPRPSSPMKKSSAKKTKAKSYFEERQRSVFETNLKIFTAPAQQQQQQQQRRTPMNFTTPIRSYRHESIDDNLENDDDNFSPPYRPRSPMRIEELDASSDMLLERSMGRLDDYDSGNEQLETLKSSIVNEVKEISNSFNTVSRAASAAKLAGYNSDGFDPALEGLAGKLVQKEQQLQMVENTKKSFSSLKPDF